MVDAHLPNGKWQRGDYRTYDDMWLQWPSAMTNQALIRLPFIKKYQT
jgi:hypothetical protein